MESYREDDHQHWPYADAGDSHEVDTAYEEVRSRRPLWIMAAMIVAGIAGIGASFGFKGAATNPSEITTIRAADGPTKIHPTRWPAPKSRIATPPSLAGCSNSRRSPP